MILAVALPITLHDLVFQNTLRQWKKDCSTLHLGANFACPIPAYRVPSRFFQLSFV